MAQAELKLVDILALDRNKLAAERTLMAWVRTALSLITFGFTIYNSCKSLTSRAEYPCCGQMRRGTSDSYLPASEPSWW